MNVGEWPLTIECDAILFDLDGTLINSLPAVDRAWTQWALRVGLQPDEVVSRIHGRRSIDSVRKLAPHLDAETENNWIRNAEASDTSGVTVIPGVLDFIEQLPRDRWAIVTSGTKDVATPRLIATGVPLPVVAVYGDDVERGKPAPDPFLRAAEMLGFPPRRCVVFEDTIAGLRSGKAAGCFTVGVRAMPGEELTAECDVVIGSYASIHVTEVHPQICLDIHRRD